jgi:hypothetical protein
MLYSLSMPFLYLAGFLIFTSMFWVDKILFMRFWRTPPKYTTEIVKRTFFLLEYAIILHLIFGLYMISNPKIFSFNSEHVDGSISWALPLTEALGRWANAWFGLSEDRFN